MSTRSYICMEKSKNVYIGIYCHTDGYLSHNGALLVDYYRKKNILKKLINKGDLLHLDTSIRHCQHCFSSNKAKTKFVDLSILDKDDWIDYIYVFGLDNNWRYFKHEKMTNGLIPLQYAVSKEYEKYGIERPKNYYGIIVSNKLKQ